MERNELEEIALRVREHIIRMSLGGGCFIGASLSCVEILVLLYSNILRRAGESRDRFFLSKGHDVPALYGTFAELNLMDKERLKKHLSTEDHLYWHPNRNIEGVEFHSGSLGHLLSVSLGVAIGSRMQGWDNRVYVLVGDGELNEGSNWEALLVANAQRIRNLTLIVDRNQFQANGRTETILPLEPLEDKFTAFGCQVQSVDGHNFDELQKGLTKLHRQPKGPTVLIANTQRGRGLPSLTERADRWFCRFSEDEVENLLKELHGQEKANLNSETLVVR